MHNSLQGFSHQDTIVVKTKSRKLNLCLTGEVGGRYDNRVVVIAVYNTTKACIISYKSRDTFMFVTQKADQYYLM